MRLLAFGAAKAKAVAAAKASHTTKAGIATPNKAGDSTPAGAEEGDLYAGIRVLKHHPLFGKHARL